MKCNWCRRDVRICMNDPCSTLKGGYVSVLTYDNDQPIKIDDAVKWNDKLAYVDKIDRAAGTVRIWLLKTPEDILWVKTEELQFLESRGTEEE